MSDEAWRTHERRWRQEPSDQDALGRVIAGMRRSGLVVPPDLLDARVEPATTLETTLPLEVWAVLPGEREPTTVGWGPGRVEIPPHRYWGVGDVPAGLEGLGALGDELRGRGIPGLRLTQLAPSRRRPEEAPRLDRDALAALGPQPQLRWLELPLRDEQRVTPGEVVRALGCAALEVFRGAALVGDGPVGERLQGFEALNQLREVEATRCRLAPDDLQALAQLPALDGLSLAGSGVGFADLEQLGLAGRLRGVRLGRLERQDVERARGFDRLTRVAMECQDPDSVADALAAIPRLQELDLGVEAPQGTARRPVDDAVRRMRGVALTSLTLRSRGLGEAGFEVLGTISTLRSLDVVGVAIPGHSGFAVLAGCRLERLRLRPGGPVRGVGALPRLRALRLDAYEGLAPDTIDQINSLSELRELRLFLATAPAGTLAPPQLRALCLQPARPRSLQVEASLRSLDVVRVADLWPGLEPTLESLRIGTSADDAEVKRLSAFEALRTLHLAPGADLPDLPERVVRIARSSPGLRRLSLEGWAWGMGLARVVHDAIARRVAEELPWVGVVDEPWDD